MTNTKVINLKQKLLEIDDWRIWHSGVNVNLAKDGSCEVNAWWPNPDKDDSSPGYKPHIDEIRASGKTEEEALTLFLAKATILPKETNHD